MGSECSPSSDLNQTSGSRVRVVVASQTVVVREALASVLNGAREVRVVATAGTVAEIVAATRESRPNVILLNHIPPEGPTVATRIAEVDAGVAVVAFGVPLQARTIAAWGRAGVLGCLAEGDGLGDLLAALESAARGERTCSSSFIPLLFEQFATNASEGALMTVLTGREQEILQHAALGLSNKQIAERLSISTATVKNHLHNAFSKLHVHGRADVAAAFAGAPDP